jgi:hypothetical protein
MFEVHKFIVFCLESYKKARNITGKQALKDFEDYDVFSYLSEGFDVLHTQGQNFIAADIMDYIAHRRK